MKEVNKVSYLYQNKEELLEVIHSGKHLKAKRENALELLDGKKNPAEVILETMKFPQTKSFSKSMKPETKKNMNRKFSELKHAIRKRTSPYVYRDRKIEGLDLKIIFQRFEFLSSISGSVEFLPTKFHSNCFLFEVK